MEKAKSEIAAAKRKIAQETLKATKASVRKVVKAKLAEEEIKTTAPVSLAANF